MWPWTELTLCVKSEITPQCSFKSDFQAGITVTKATVKHEPLYYPQEWSRANLGRSAGWKTANKYKNVSKKGFKSSSVCQRHAQKHLPVCSQRPPLPWRRPRLRFTWQRGRVGSRARLSFHGELLAAGSNLTAGLIEAAQSTALPVCMGVKKDKKNGIIKPAGLQKAELNVLEEEHSSQSIMFLCICWNQGVAPCK